ncbi:MAG: hypothetical protein IJ702_04400 [Fretibacterium sp.]|nr:hypothetical protein [Fretibacterium sp.]
MIDRMTDTLEDELDAIRLRLYEEVKMMTPEERIVHLRTKAEPIMKQYNLKWATLKPVKPRRRERAAD